MPGLNETKASILSIQNTQKITRAMYLVSASKSKRARRMYEQTLPYFRQIAVTLSEILVETVPFSTPFLSGFPYSAQKGNLYLVLAGDKGLAGGYNHNLIELLENTVDKNADTLWVAGFTGRSRIASKGYKVASEFDYPVMNPSLFRAREVMEQLVEAYLTAAYRQVHIVFTEMINPLNLKPTIAQLLPLKPEDLTHRSPDADLYKKAEYEPGRTVVFDHLVPHYIKGIIYGAFVEAYTSEQNARMYAMDNATKSAGDMIGQLSLRYNRARQAQITQEITEIVGGIPNE